MKKTFLIFGFFAFLSSISYASERKGDILDQEDYDPETPYYQIVPTNWSAGFRAAFHLVPTKDSIGSVSELFFEKHLLFQKVGVLSLGVHAGVVPLNFDRYDNVKFGGLIRYQLHLIKNQILVPTVALVYDVFRLKNGKNTVNSYNSFGPMFGVMLNLGFFDRSTSRDGYQSIGLNRAYLTLDYRPIDMSSYNYAKTIGTTTTTVQGSSSSLWYMGIRLEFE